MSDPGIMRREQPLSSRAVHPQDLLPAVLLRRLPACQGGVADKLHDDVHLVSDLAHFIDLDDVGSRDAGQRLGLADDADAKLGALLVFRMDDLNRDLAVQILVVGGVDDAHRSLADLAQQDVAADAHDHAGEDGLFLQVGDRLDQRTGIDSLPKQGLRSRRIHRIS